MNLIIDIGNTSAKLAVFEKGEMKDMLRCSNRSLQGVEAFCSRYPIQKGIISSVVSLTDEISHTIHALPFPIMEFTYQTPIPIKNLYKTPETLGMDRLAAVIAAQAMKPSCPILVIDAGTCITYDFIDEEDRVLVTKHKDFNKAIELLSARFQNCDVNEVADKLYWDLQLVHSVKNFDYKQYAIVVYETEELIPGVIDKMYENNWL